MFAVSLAVCMHTMENSHAHTHNDTLAHEHCKIQIQKMIGITDTNKKHDMNAIVSAILTVAPVPLPSCKATTKRLSVNCLIESPGSAPQCLRALTGSPELTMFKHLTFPDPRLRA